MLKVSNLQGAIPNESNGIRISPQLLPILPRNGRNLSGRENAPAGAVKLRRDSTQSGNGRAERMDIFLENRNQEWNTCRPL